jgi:phage gpG-like protein
MERILELKEMIEGEIKKSAINKAMSVVPDIVSESIQRNFEEGGRYGGGKAGGGTEKWEPSKRVKRYGGKTLVNTGRLRNSIGVIVSNVQNGISVKMEAGVEYGAIHQSGGRRTPRRPFLVIQDEDIERIGEAIEKEMRK